MTARRASLSLASMAAPFIVAAAILMALRLAAAAEVIPPSSSQIDLEVRKGSLVRLDKPASNVFIADPEVADVQIKSPQLLYVFGKAPGETSLYALSDDDRVLFSAGITVRHNVSRLNAGLGQMLPNARVQATSFDGSIMLNGQVDSPRDAEDARRLAEKFAGTSDLVLNNVTVQGPAQVNLRVRVAEVSREVMKQLGFNWEAAVVGNDYLLGIATGADAVSTIADPVTGLPVRTFSTLNNGTHSYVGSLTSGKLDINAVVDALETEGLVSILAEPNLTAISGESASFLAGGEFPVPVPQRNRDTITIAFKQFGVGLSFTPTVLSDDRINLKILPEVSQLTSAGSVSLAGFSIPGLTTRRAQTTVELGSGQSFAIAGLLQSNVVRDLSKLPGFGDIPILGALFRSDGFRRNETELVFIVTPYIVQPVSNHRLATPNAGFEAPNDIERIIGGQAYRPTALDSEPPAPTSQGRQLIGPAGFVLN